MSLKNRFLADITFFYKAHNGISNINIDSYVDFSFHCIFIICIRIYSLPGGLSFIGSWTPLRIIHMAIYIILISMYYL